MISTDTLSVPASPRHARAPAAVALLVFAVAAHADDAPAGGNTVTLEKVTVTAEKQGRSQHDTATSTEVLTEDDLRRRGLDSSRDVFADMANVTTVGQANAAPAIRGIDGTGAAQGVDAFFAGSRPRLDVTVDGRPLSYNELVFGDSGLWDVQQIELLRGTQSLLQGRNAIAGTMAIKTNDPSFTPEAGMLFSAGQYDRRQGAFYATGPILGDELAFRISGDVQRRDSFLAFSAFPGTTDPGQFDTRTFRAKLLYKPDALPDFSELVTVQHADSRAPQVESVLRPFDSGVASTLTMPVFESRSNALVSDTNWQVTDRLKFQNLLTATDLHVDRFAPAGTGIARIGTDQYTWEPNFVLDRAGSFFGGIAGLYFFNADQHEFIDYPIDENFHDRVNTSAVYGQGTFAIADQVDLTLGARYEREKHRRDGGDGYLVAIDIDKTYSAFLPKFDLAWHPNSAWTFGILAQRGYNAGGAGVAFTLPISTYSYDSEYVRDYEAYFRGDLADGRIQVNGNLFYGDYDNLQLPYVLDPDPLHYAYVIRNAKRAYNAGAEVGLRWLVATGLDVHASLGLLRTRITDYPGSGAEGNQFANAPKSTASFGVSWRGENGLEFNADMRHSAGYFSDVENYAFARIDPYWTGRIKAGWRFGNTYLFTGVDNVTDNRKPLNIWPATSVPTAYDSASMPQPRTWYAGVQFDFR